VSGISKAHLEENVGVFSLGHHGTNKVALTDSLVYANDEIVCEIQFCEVTPAN